MRPFLVLAFTLHAIGVGASARAEEPSPALQIGAPAPPFSLRTLNPDRSGAAFISLAKLVGPRAGAPRSFVVLSFGASYCEPCRRELEELKALVPDLEAARVLLVVVVADTDPEGIEAMRKLTIDELGLTVPVLSDRFGVLARRYHASPLPFTVVIDANGLVRAVRTGFSRDSIPELLRLLGLQQRGPLGLSDVPSSSAAVERSPGSASRHRLAKPPPRAVGPAPATGGPQRAPRKP